MVFGSNGFQQSSIENGCNGEKGLQELHHSLYFFPPGKSFTTEGNSFSNRELNENKIMNPKTFQVNWLPLREIFLPTRVKFAELARDEWNWTLLQTYFSDLFWSLNYSVFSRPTSLIGKKRRFLFCNWVFSTSIVTQESYLCKTLSLI